MVAITQDNKHQALFDSAPGPEEHQKLSVKQLKRLEEQRAREAKKIAKRKAKAVQKERKAVEKEQKEAKREQRSKDEQNSGLSAREMVEQERLAEERRLFEEEFLQEDAILPAHHVKKSACDSNRLGGMHIC